jgi:type VI secretion system secreted protein VgrG
MVVVSVAPAFGTTVNLGSADVFGMLGGTISQTGTSLVQGDVGGTTSVTGFYPLDLAATGHATGSVLLAGPVVAQAVIDFKNALTTAAADLPTQTETGFAALTQTFLGGGVYAFPNIALTTSTAATTLTFDAQNQSNAVFIMQFPGALTINGPITFDLIHGALASNIYWIVGSVAIPEAMTIDPTNIPGNQMVWDGNILAGTFTMSGNSGDLSGTINGCVLTVNANTLANTTDINGCYATGESVPEPGSLGLVTLGGLLGALGLRKLRA